MLDYKSFHSEIDVKEWIFKNYLPFITDIQNKIARNERCFADIIYEYGGSAYQGYNDFLRAVKNKEDIIQRNKNNIHFRDLINDIELLKLKISEYPLKDNVILYRYSKLPIYEMFKLLFHTKGYIYTEYGFMSTTFLPFLEGMIDFADKGRYLVLFKIRVSKNIPAIPLVFNGSQTCLKEYEMLFMPGSKLEMIKKSINIKMWRPLFEIEFNFVQ
jgi:hypothetical protein